MIKAAEQRGRNRTLQAVTWEALALVVITELGDRTKFTALFLATEPSCTRLAIGAGKRIGERLSEKRLHKLSGKLVPGRRTHLSQISVKPQNRLSSFVFR